VLEAVLLPGRSITALSPRLLICLLRPQGYLVEFANPFQLGFESSIILQLATDRGDLLAPQTDVANFPSWVGNCQHFDRMSSPSITLRTALTMADDAS
jgi:hypothetical protein